MYVVIIAWMYVVLLMAAAEALSSQGTVLGALFTLVLYGLLPLSIVVYILATPARKRARALREAGSAARVAADGDGGGHAAVGAEDAVAPERKEG
jgi:mannose/fructose/N-acetylgalactosamine-specific phosphotransferase system component IID